MFKRCFVIDYHFGILIIYEGLWGICFSTKWHGSDKVWTEGNALAFEIFLYWWRKIFAANPSLMIY